MTGSRHDDPAVTAIFAKDPGEERFLAELNSTLAPFEESGYIDIAADQTRSSVFVVGVPRSGTTLLSQLLATCLDVGYPNNLVAAFWSAPTVGARLARKLVPRAPASSFASTFGRTSGLHEPHEWGAFWRNLLGYDTLHAPAPGHDDRIDWTRVTRVLRNLGAAFARPAMYKNFFAPWHASRLLVALPRSLFVVVRRDPVDNALSLLKMRRDMLGDVARWASFKPAEYERLRHLPVADQVAGQVVYMQAAIERLLGNLDPARVLALDLPDLCARPASAVSRIADALGALGDAPAVIAQPPHSFVLGVPAATWPDAGERDAVAAAVRAVAARGAQS